MPRGHRLWVLPISQRFTLEMTSNPLFFLNLMPFDYTKRHFLSWPFPGSKLFLEEEARHLLLIKTL